MRIRSIAGGETGTVLEVTDGGWVTIHWDMGAITDIWAAFSRGLIEVV